MPGITPVKRLAGSRPHKNITGGILLFGQRQILIDHLYPPCPPRARVQVQNRVALLRDRAAIGFVNAGYRFHQRGFIRTVIPH